MTKLYTVQTAVQESNRPEDQAYVGWDLLFPTLEAAQTAVQAAHDEVWEDETEAVVWRSESTKRWIAQANDAIYTIVEADLA